MFIKLFIIFLSAAILSGCVGRNPTLQPVMRISDAEKSCTALESESNTIAATAASKIAKNNSDDGGDVAIGVIGVILFWPLLFAMDTKNADGIEGNNLVDRIEHLKVIAVDKGCDTGAWPIIEKYS